MVNVWAPAALTKAFLPGMIERRTGRIVNVGSSAAVATIPGAAPYCVTKSALERLTAAIQAELATDSGISISCIRIEERIETESNARMAAQGIGGSIDVESPTTAAEFGDAVVWLTRQTQEFGGRTLTLAQLRHVGAIRPRDG
jgi:3-oxoacyl-[acyl-carrier protein] reductase